MVALHKLAFVSAIAFCSACLPAAARPATDVSEVSVSAADLDLTTTQGVKTLKQRIHAAAKSVCMEVLPNTSVSSDQVRTCRIEAAQHSWPAVQSAMGEAEAKQVVSVEASVIPR